MKKHKSFIVFYIVDLIIIIGSLIAAISENASISYGLAALESMGKFVMYLSILIIAVFLFILVSIIIIIRKFITRKNK